MRMLVNKILCYSLLLLMIAGVIGFSLRFSGSAIHWQTTLTQVRSGLLVWRLCLYSAIVLIGFSLRRRLQARYPQHLPHFKRLAWHGCNK